MVTFVAIPVIAIWLQIWKLVHLLPQIDLLSPGIKRMGNKPSGWSFSSRATFGLECTLKVKVFHYLRCELHLSVHLKLEVHLGTVRPLLFPTSDAMSLFTFLFSLFSIKYSNSLPSIGQTCVMFNLWKFRQ